MKRCLLGILLIMSINLSAQQLQQHRWQNRLLVIVENDPNSAKKQEQLAILKKDKEGITERKLLIYQISEKGYRKGLSTNKEWLDMEENFKLTRSNNNTFTIYLIGLDGGIKMKKQNPVGLSTIFALIDGMPMRQAELRND